MGIWVDTDFAFDDLWALLVLRHLGVQIDGLSLVAGVVSLEQVCRNALSARAFFDFQWTVSAGAAQPLKRTPETAERIVGPLGMQTRGRCLPQNVDCDANETRLPDWLADQHQAEVLALGPLTNLANLYLNHAVVAQRIHKIVWMGGASARGNHTPFAEFNAIADPEALDILVQNNAPLKIVDLELCRQVIFSENHLGLLHGEKGALLMDLTGGYLDIALSRGRTSMAIYDPVAAFVLADGEFVTTVASSLSVCTQVGEKYGQTIFQPDESSCIQLVTDVDPDRVRSVCFAALENESR